VGVTVKEFRHFSRRHDDISSLYIRELQRCLATSTRTNYPRCLISKTLATSTLASIGKKDRPRRLGYFFHPFHDFRPNSVHHEKPCHGSVSKESEPMNQEGRTG
jgi:hypothetical protein